ncbi:hypothetical protein [Methylobacterium nodulans]|uniref:Uncharacterized protein n=1 Tax=Methylobacterium nodulans (strain LMG 21967 / CNCM I-2342 / ORS 2060) TaxID=460265 RepID=B8IH41_METNO|nr:hypothetical protein [Methylobacterium nodulans]ACL59733.1 conserved hypothetical protein [Methylobacterium nodulans ORS 2060]
MVERSSLPADTPPLAPGKGALLTLAGMAVGGPGYYWSYTHHSAVGTLVGVIGISLCILGTAKSEGPVHPW